MAHMPCSLQSQRLRWPPQAVLSFRRGGDGSFTLFSLVALAAMVAASCVELSQ